MRKITEVSKEEWDRVYSDELEGYDYFRAMDESNFDPFSFYYITVYDNNTLVGAAPCFFTKYSLDTSIGGLLRHWTNALKKFFPNLLTLRTIICGLPLSKGRIGFSGRADEVFEAVLRGIEEIAVKEKTSIIALKDFDDTYNDLLAPLLKNGFLKVDSLPSAEMDIPFASFEEYLQTLSGASRYDLRRKFKKVDGHIKIDMEIVTTPDEETLREIYRLYLEVIEKHEMRFEILPIAFFANIATNMPDRVKFFLWKVNGKLVAFLLALVSKNLMNDYYLGLDYSVAYEYHLFFIKFRDVMNWCLDRKIKRYVIGTSGYEPKRRLGFDFVPLYLYIKCRNRLIRPFFTLGVKWLMRFEDFDPELKKIKKGVS